MNEDPSRDDDEEIPSNSGKSWRPLGEQEFSLLSHVAAKKNELNEIDKEIKELGASRTRLEKTRDRLVKFGPIFVALVGPVSWHIWKTCFENPHADVGRIYAENLPEFISTVVFGIILALAVRYAMTRQAR